MNIQDLHSNFKRAFPDSGEPRFFYAPGRVNLIGEHIDYNGGYVFPCALTLGNYAAICRRDDSIVRLISEKYKPFVSLDLNDLSYNAAHSWANLPKGAAKLLKDMGHNIGGFDMYICGNLPGSAGLSSSASVTVLSVLALDAIFDLGIQQVDKALLSQRVENEYIGVNCGIMDQFASAMGLKDHAILLNCSNLEYKHVPLELGDYQLILANTNASRRLADSKYNERRAECEQALAILNAACDAKNLCDIETSKFTEYCRATFGDKVISQGFRVLTEPLLDPADRDTSPVTPEEIAFKRAYHAVTENERVKFAVDVLNRGDLAAFGEAMIGSHVSLRDFYEVSGKELDALVAAALELDEGFESAQGKCDSEVGSAPPQRNKVLGSRMTGAGFGGCTVNIVRKDCTDEFIRVVGKRYTDMTGMTAEFYVAEVDDGAREIFG